MSNRKFKYRWVTVDFKDSNEMQSKELNKLGDEGWMAVGVVQGFRPGEVRVLMSSLKPKEKSTRMQLPRRS